MIEFMVDFVCILHAAVCCCLLPCGPRAVRCRRLACSLLPATAHYLLPDGCCFMLAAAADYRY